MNVLFGATLILFLFCFLELITAHTLGGGIYVLLALAVVSVIVWLIIRKK